MANVNTLSYTSSINDALSVSSKPYTDKSDGFDNILETASKTYEKEDNSSSKRVDTKKEDQKESLTKSNTDNRADKADKADKKPEVRDEETGNRKQETVDSEQETEVAPKTETKTADKTDSQADSKAELSQVVENAANAVAETVSAIATPVAEVLDAVANTLNQATQPQTAQETAKETDIKVESAQQAMSAKDLAEAAKTAKAQVQPQTQQVLLNLQTEDTPSVPTETATAPQAPSTEELSAKAPLVQANADTTAEANAKMSKKELKEALQQSGLSQDLLDKTNAKVVSVETSSTSGNLLNKQNAQEQGAKIAFENTGTNAADTAMQANQTTQVSFDKTLSNAQQPKELSKTDILAQINTKFEQLKDDSTTKVTIVLKPENLGKINLELINGKDGLTARMTTENAQVKELLDKNLDTLRGSLGAQGVNVNNVSVKVAEAQTPSNENFSFEQKEFTQDNPQPQDSKGNSGQKNYNFEENFANATNASASESEEPTTTAHKGQIDYKI